MVKRLGFVFVLVLLYMAVWAALLYGIIFLAGEDEGLLLTALLAVMAFLILAFIPYLDQVVKHAFTFHGKGQTVPVSIMRRQILAINRYQAPVMAEERLYELVLTWRYTDTHWWEALSKAGLQRLYELHVKLDEKRHVATLIDVTRSVQWRTGPSQVQAGGRYGRGIFAGYEIGEQWGIAENWERSGDLNFKFVPAEIKTPVMNTLLRSGWDVRFGIW